VLHTAAVASHLVAQSFGKKSELVALLSISVAEGFPGVCSGFISWL